MGEATDTSEAYNNAFEIVKSICWIRTV